MKVDLPECPDSSFRARPLEPAAFKGGAALSMPAELVPLHPSVGVELPRARALEASEAIRTAANRHACVLLRDQNLSPSELMSLAGTLGSPLPPYRPQYSVPRFPEVVQVGNIRSEGQAVSYLNRGGIEWRTDSPGSSHPPGFSLLYCIESELPNGGGETGFVSTVSGYAQLPSDLQATAKELTLVHSFNTFNDQVADYEGSEVPAQSGELRVRNRDTADPMVQTHPATGAEHLYFSHAMIKESPGFEHRTGMDLVMQIHDAITAPNLVYKHRWSSGDLIVFDNRICLHTPYPYAFDDYPRTRRLLHQIIIGGHQPEGNTP